MERVGLQFCIDNFATSVHPRDGHPKIFAMIDAYIDESGIHEGAAVCVVAGYFAGRGQWRKFEKEWRKVFKDFGMPMEEFHAKTLLKKEDPKHKRLALALAKVISGFAAKVHPVSAAIIVKDFLSFSLDDRKFMTGATWKNDKLVGTGSPEKSYYIPFQHCLKRVCRYAPVGGRAHFFFGLGKSFSGYALSLFEQAKLDPLSPYRERLGDIDFPEAKFTPQLQAADLLAHLSYQFSTERAEHDNWGMVQPKGLLGYALNGTLDQADHTFQDRECLEITLTNGIRKFYESLKNSSSLPVT